MSNFVQIQSGNFRALVLPHNIDKVEAALAKVKAPAPYPFKRTRYDNARSFPMFDSKMTTCEYVQQYERMNNRLNLHAGTFDCPGYLFEPTQYDASVPLCVEDTNPDYVPGLDDAPVKPKRTRKAIKPAPDKAAIMWILIDHGLTSYQASPAADKLIALFEGTTK
jgi:hypothetical protein